MESRKKMIPRYTAAVGTNNHDKYFYYKSEGMSSSPLLWLLVLLSQHGRQHAYKIQFNPDITAISSKISN
jgi:hypothetical protein